MSEAMTKSYVHIKFIGAAKGEVRSEVSVMQVQGESMSQEEIDAAIGTAKRLFTDAEAFTKDPISNYEMAGDAAILAGLQQGAG